MDQMFPEHKSCAFQEHKNNYGVDELGKNVQTI
jgi:hypothetical protein